MADASRPSPRRRIDDVVAHSEHVREVAGVETSGSAATTTASTCCPVGLEDVSGYPRLLAALADRAGSDADLAKLAGGNVLRVIGDAEAGPASSQHPGAQPRPDRGPRRPGRSRPGTSGRVHRRRLTGAPPRAGSATEAGDGEGDEAGEHHRDVHDAGELLDHAERRAFGRIGVMSDRPDAGQRRDREVEQLDPRARGVGRFTAAVNEPGQIIWTAQVDVGEPPGGTVNRLRWRTARPW